MSLIHFGTIESDDMYDPDADNEEMGHSHQRKVKWTGVILELDSLPDPLKRSTRDIRAVADLTPHVEIIENLIQKEGFVEPVRFSSSNRFP